MTAGLQAAFTTSLGRFTLDARLQLPADGVTALFGPSGCGKTTLLRCLAGLHRAAGGRLRLGDAVWQDERRFVPPHRRAVGLVFQEASLFPHLTVRGNLCFGQRRVPAAQQRVRVDTAIELLSIGALLERRPAHLSGGERQRVAIARALAVSPQLLLMDEPLAALDAAAKAEILPLLERLTCELRIPVVYVSHAVGEVLRLADRVVLMQQGRVHAQGSVAEVLSRADLPLAEGDEPGVVLGAVVAAIDTRWSLAHLHFDGGALWARDPGLPTGSAVRVRVLARDVSLASSAQPGSSIGNQLAGSFEAALDDPSHPALALVRVRIGAAPLLARVTRRSLHAMQLQPGAPVWALLKSVVLME
jgi:molybdate transport system ATP-binding protein